MEEEEERDRQIEAARLVAIEVGSLLSETTMTAIHFIICYMYNISYTVYSTTKLLI